MSGDNPFGSGERGLSPVSVRRNRTILLAEVTLFMFASSVLDVRTLLPAFVRGYSSSLILIGLLPAIRSGGNLLPQLIAAHFMRSHARKKPWLIAGCLIRSLPVAATALLLVFQPHASAAMVLGLLYVSLTIFAVANSFGSLAWWDILGKVIPRGERPGFFGGMMVGASTMGIAAGLLAKALFDSPRWHFPQNYGVLFALAFTALAVGVTLFFWLDEPAGSGEPRAGTRLGSIEQLRRLLGDGGPFARLMRVQLLIGVPAIAQGIYTPYALGELKLPLDVTGIFVSAAGVGVGVGGLLLPIVARRRDSRTVLAVVAVSIILSPLLVALAGSIPAAKWIREACCAASFACQGLATTGLFIGVNDLVLAMSPPAERPLYVGLSNTVAGLLVPLPLIGGVIAQKFGSAALLWLCPLPAFAGLAALRNLHPHAPSTTGGSVRKVEEHS